MTKQQFKTMDLRPLKINSMDIVEQGIKIADKKNKEFKKNMNNKEFMKKYEVDV